MARKKKPSDVVALAQQTVAQDSELSLLVRHYVDYANDPRFNELDRKEGYFRGTIYDRRPYDWYGTPILKGYEALNVGQQMPFFTGSDKAPVTARQPDTKYALGRVIANRFAALLFGQRVFPHFSVPKSKSTEQFVNALVKKTQLRLHMQHAAQLGGGMGSIIVMFKVVEGKFKLESFNTKWVTPLWEDFTENEMRAFMVSMPISKREWNDDKKKWEVKVYLYKRVVTEDFDIEFELQEAKLVVHGTGVSVKPIDERALPRPNAEKTFYHGLGFVPAQFIQHLPRPDAVDGDCAFETAEELIDRINENLSAVHHAMQGNLDPTLVLKITPEDYKKLIAMGGVVHTGADGEGLVVGDKGDAKFIEITCEGIKVAMDIIEKLRTYALELCDCVIADPHKLTGAAQSAAAINLLYTPMLNKTDVLRVQYGEQALRKLIGKMLRAWHVLSGVTETEDGMEQCVFKAMCVKDPETGDMINVEPEEDIDYDDIELRWGDYFPATTADMFQAAEAAVMAAGGKAATTQAQAAKMLAPYFGDHEVDHTIAKLAQQEEEALKREDDVMQKQAQMKAASAPKPGAKPKPGA